MLDMDNVENVSMIRPCCYCCTKAGRIDVEIKGDASSKEQKIQHVKMYFTGASEVFDQLQAIVHSGDARVSAISGDQ